MKAHRASGWVVGLGFLALLPASALRAQDAALGIALPDPPPALSLDGPAAANASLRIVVPAAPEVVLDLRGADPIHTAASAAEAVPAPAAPRPAPAVIAARLADPRLPLPPKLSRRDREALTAYYGAAAHSPLWLKDGAWTEAGQAIVARLQRADEDGLDPADYPIPILQAGSRPLSDEELAEAELKLSAAAFLYARDARGGRIDPLRISGLVTPKLAIPTVEAVLAKLTASIDPAGTLASYQPAYPGYAALKAKLADIRASRPSVRGPASRNRQAIAAIDDFDTPARMPRASDPRLEGDIVANMERWRWLPADVATRYVSVNVPEYRLRLIEDGRVVHEARVITGAVATPTPIFSGIMDHAIVNPSWYIPPSILKKEILPGLAKDPEYAARRGYEVVRRGKSVTVRQPPGARNALGYIKFMFPNDHAVYLHDTPSRGLFGAGRRALSHGCVRVENPFAFGATVLGGAWTEARLKSLVGHGERTIHLTEKLPVNLTYFTVSVDEYGDLATFEDVYGYNRRVRAALGLGA